MLKGVRFRKGLSLAKGVRLNLSKSGVSLSLGKKGMTYNIGPKGTRGTVGLPGSGLSYSSQGRYDENVLEGQSKWNAQRVFRWIVLGAVLIYLVSQALQ
jgi:hypothetical protein